ncbi:hypothetical protein F5883DRAFT_533443 [Diaporthe sp. PMI_573]|nr:hypothetical protein F5883DRAFT_533443 [Diaporthaceae sp. PMI_573]
MSCVIRSCCVFLSLSADRLNHGGWLLIVSLSNPSRRGKTSCSWQLLHRSDEVIAVCYHLSSPIPCLEPASCLALSRTSLRPGLPRMSESGTPTGMHGTAHRAASVTTCAPDRRHIPALEIYRLKMS